MRVITANVNGIRAACKKGFNAWLKSQDADFVCLQETKIQLDNLGDSVDFFPEGYYCVYQESTVKKGYSGVAIYAKKTPDNIVSNIDFAYADTEGRYLRFDYPNFSVLSIYFPSGTSGELRQSVKYEFLDAIFSHLHELRKTQPKLIICGDYNIAHQKIDLKNWRGNQKNSGFLPEERAWLDKLFGGEEFFDAFRLLNKEADEYTWWSYRFKAWDKNVGWRIDYQVITKELVPALQNVHIYKDERFSDHAPVIMDYKDEFF